MIKYQVLRGVSLPEATELPTLNITPEGRAIGSVPGWQMLMDPGRVANSLPRNRVVASEYLRPYATWAAYEYSAFPNGAPSLDLEPGEQRLYPDKGFNPDAWSLFVVVNVFAGDPGSRAIAYAHPDYRGDTPFPRIALNSEATSVNVFEGGATVRVGYTPPGGFMGAGPGLLMFTFSTREGLRIFHNGAAVAHKPEDTRPFASGFAAGQWYLFDTAWTGQAGMAGLLSIDLGWPEHAGYRRAIERFLTDKYGIAA